MGVGLEVAACGCLDPVGLAAIEDGVEVHLEDLVLAVLTVELNREDGFFELSLDIGGGVGSDVDLLDQLLADGAATLLDLVVLIVGDGGADDAAEVDAAVRVERAVLGGERRLHHPWGDIVERHDDPVVAGLADVGQQGAVAIVDQGVLLHLVGGKPANGRQGTHGLRRDRRDAE